MMVVFRRNIMDTDMVMNENTVLGYSCSGEEVLAVFELRDIEITLFQSKN